MNKKNKRINQYNLFIEFTREFNIKNNFSSLIAKHISKNSSISWFNTLTNKYSVQTLKKVLQLLRKFEKYVYTKTGITIPYSMVSLPSKKPLDLALKEKRRAFNKSETTKLVQYLINYDDSVPGNYDYAYFVLFGLYTGLRIGEIRGIRPIDFNWQDNYIHVSSQLNNYGHRTACKANEEKIIPIPQPLADWLKLRCYSLDKHDLVFPYRDKEFRAYWRALLAHLAIPYRVPHVLRHTYATHALLQGIPINQVAKALGHSDLAMVSRVYGQIPSEIIRPITYDY